MRFLAAYLALLGLVLWSPVASAQGRTSVVDKADRDPMRDAPGSTHAFALYLVKTAVDVTDGDAVGRVKLGELGLEPEPILTDADIVRYEWDTHTVYLKLGVRERIMPKEQRLRGTPFVVVCRGERIYLGAFWQLISSWLCRVPYILIRDYGLVRADGSHIENAILIRGADVLPKSGTTYPHDDQRICESLQGIGKCGPEASVRIKDADGLRVSIAAPGTATSEGETNGPLAEARKRLKSVHTAMECYVVDHSVWPEEWHQITTPIAYVRGVPSDPYAKGRTLSWEKMAGGDSVVYSIGPDGVDQHGAVAYDPTNGAKSAGDLVFRFTQDPDALATKRAEPTPVLSPTPTPTPILFKVRGRIESSGNRPVEGATVRVRAGEDRSIGLGEVQTDAGGRFELGFGEGYVDAESGNMVPRLVFLEVSCPGMIEAGGGKSGAYVIARERPSEEELAKFKSRKGVILAGDPRWLQVRMNRFSTLVATVMDAGKRPLGNLPLVLYPPSYIASSSVWEGKTDEAGRFTVPAIWSGSRYSLEIEGRGRVPVNLVAPGERRLRFICREGAIDIEEPAESTLPKGCVPTLDELQTIVQKRRWLHGSTPFHIEYTLTEKSNLNAPDPVRRTEHILEVQYDCFRETVRNQDGVSIELRKMWDQRVEIGDYPDLFRGAAPQGKSRRRLRYLAHDVRHACEGSIIRWGNGATLSYVAALWGVPLIASFREAQEAGNLTVRRETLEGLDCVTFEVGGRVVSFAPSRDWSLVRYYDTRFSEFRQVDGFWVPGRITSESSFKTLDPAHPWANVQAEIVVNSLRVADDFRVKGYWPMPEPRDGDRVQVEYPKWRSEWGKVEDGKVASVRPQTVRDACKSGQDLDWGDSLHVRNRMIYEISTHWREKLRIDTALARDSVKGDLHQAPLPFYDAANEEIVWATYTGSLVRVGMLPSAHEIEVGPYRARAWFRPDANRIRVGQPVKVKFGVENTATRLSTWKPAAATGAGATSATSSGRLTRRACPAGFSGASTASAEGWGAPCHRSHRAGSGVRRWNSTNG